MIDVFFLDSGLEPQNKADPKYLNGMEVDLREHALQKYCCRNLPYPAPRCGVYSIKCRVCGLVIALTVAGRADDPRSVTLPCKAQGMN